MKPIILLSLMWLSSYGMVASFNDTNLTIGLFNQPTGAVSKNIGTVIPVKGPNAPSSVTATLDRMPEAYGWNSNLGSYRFNNTTSNIVFSNDVGNLADNKLTVACWLRMEDFTGEKNIWAKVVTSAIKIVIHRQHTDTFQIRVCDGSSNSFISFLRPSGNAEANMWFSLITVIDVTQAVNTDRIKVYINGIPCAIAGTPGTIPNALPYVDTTALRIGGWGAGAPTVGINGEFKYMLTFNTAKTVTDVNALYTLGPDLGGLALDSAGKLYSTATFAFDYHPKRAQSTGLNSSKTGQIRYRMVDLSGRKINTRVLTGGAVMNTNQTVQTRHSSGFYLIGKTGLESGEVSRQRVVLFGK